MKIIKVVIVVLFLGMFFLYLNFFSPLVMPWQKAEAIEAALEWGQLAELPSDADIISMEKRGSIFTRQFIIEFTSSETEIRKWILKSKGFRKSELKMKNGIIIYEIHPKDGKAYGGRVEVNENKVLINMSWS